MAVQFKDTSVSHTGYKRKWYFGDGSTDTARIVKHTYQDSGHFTVKLVVTNTNQCSDSASALIQVTLSPKAKLVYDTAGCVGSLINYGDSSTNRISGYRYLFYGDGNVEFSSKITNHSFSTAGSYTPSLIVANNNGCTDTAYGHITIYPIPTPKLSYSTPLCLSDSVILIDISSPKNISRSWQFGDMTSMSNAKDTVYHKYYSAGTYNVGLTAVNRLGCQGYTSQQITVNPNPTAVFTYDSAACFGSGISLVDKSVVSNEIRSWSFGDGSTNALQSQAYNYANPGKYTVKLSIKDNNGCLASDSAKITIYPLPLALFYIKDTAQCISNAFVFLDSSAIVSGSIKKWNWSFGDGTASSLQNPTKHNYKTTGVFDIKLNLTSNYGCTSATDRSVLIFPQPKASFTLKDTTQCLSANSFAFTNTSTISSGRIATYIWKFGDGTQALAQTPGSHYYANAGSYIPQLNVISIDGCTDSAMAHLTVHAVPVVSFAVNDSIQCLNGNNFKFTDKSSISTGSLAKWNWDFGNTKTATTASVANIYTKPGTYPVKLSITSDKGCTASRTDSMTVHANPVANAGTPAAICAGTADTLGVAAIGGISYSWTSVPTGFSATQSNPVVHPATNTKYLLTETDSASDCQATDSVIIIVKRQPLSQWKEINIGSDYIFAASDSSFSSTDYKWTFGDGSTQATGYHASHVYPKNKTYLVKLMVSDTDGCSSEMDSSINVTISGISGAQASGWHIKLYPNPFDENTIIACSTGTATNLRMSLYDLNGKRIGNIADKTIEPGIYQWNINAENYQLKKGVYILKVITPEGEINYRLVKM